MNDDLKMLIISCIIISYLFGVFTFLCLFDIKSITEVKVGTKSKPKIIIYRNNLYKVKQVKDYTILYEY